MFLGIPLYVALIGLLNAQYTLTGYDASAHMSEETHDADKAAPRGIVFSVVDLGHLRVHPAGRDERRHHARQDLPGADGTMVDGYTHALQSPTGVPPVQIWIDAVGQQLGIFILFLVVGAQFFCGMSSVTANSRMIYAFSRDGAVPGSSFWHRINKRTRTPTNSIWLAAVGAFILGLPYLYSPVAYFAITSIAVIGLYVAYIAPVFLRLRAGNKFEPGPWTPGSLEPADRDRGDDLGRLHLHPVHAAAGLPDHDPDVQLHAGRVPRRPRRCGDLVLRLGEALVQGTEGPGRRPRSLPQIERDLEVI